MVAFSKLHLLFFPRIQFNDGWRQVKQGERRVQLVRKERLVGNSRRRRVRPAGVDCEDEAENLCVRWWRIRRIAAATTGWTKRNTTINLLDDEDEGENVS